MSAIEQTPCAGYSSAIPGTGALHVSPSNHSAGSHWQAVNNQCDSDDGMQRYTAGTPREIMNLLPLGTTCRGSLYMG